VAENGALALSSRPFPTTTTCPPLAMLVERETYDAAARLLPQLEAEHAALSAAAGRRRAGAGHAADEHRATHLASQPRMKLALAGVAIVCSLLACAQDRASAKGESMETRPSDEALAAAVGAPGKKVKQVGGGPYLYQFVVDGAGYQVIAIDGKV